MCLACAGQAGADHVSLLRELMERVSGSSGMVDAQDSWLLRDVDETSHSGTVQLEPFAPSADVGVASLVIDSDTEDSMYAVPEPKAASGKAIVWSNCTSCFPWARLVEVASCTAH